MIDSKKKEEDVEHTEEDDEMQDVEDITQMHENLVSGIVNRRAARNRLKTNIYTIRRMPKEIHRRLKLTAARQDSSMEEVVLAILDMHLPRYGGMESE
jgi:predicted HicB family RNase H-like nuclease